MLYAPDNSTSFSFPERQKGTHHESYEAELPCSGS